MRKFAAMVIALLVLLPAVDTVVCPDGCTDVIHHSLTVERGTNRAAGGACGLCLNARFAPCDTAFVEGLTGETPMIVAVSVDSPVGIVRVIDRPPRLD